MNAIQALQQQRLLLQLEYQTEKEAYQRQTEQQGLARLVKRGDAWWPVRIGRSFYNSMNQLCVEVFRTADNDVEHQFEYGRPVAFFREERTDGAYETIGGHQPHIKYFPQTATAWWSLSPRVCR